MILKQKTACKPSLHKCKLFNEYKENFISPLMLKENNKANFRSCGNQILKT